MELSKIVELQRKAIYLLSDESLRSEVMERDTFIARNFYYQKRVLLDDLERSIAGTDIVTVSSKQRSKNIDKFFHYTDSQQVRAADLLAFIDVIDALIYNHHQNPFLSQKQLAKARSLQADLDKITQSYGKHLSDISQKLGMRGKQIEPWSDYIEFLKTLFSREKIRKEFNKDQSDLKSPATRGAGTSKKANPNLLWGFGIPEKAVVLTFDDGPHYRYTDTGLDILKKYNAKGYFFTVGKNFGIIDEQELSLKKNAEKIKRALNEGHLVGNHTFTHPVLTKLSQQDREREIEDTNALLTMVTGQKNTVFRPPYGSRDDGLQTLTEEKGMRSVMWNIDSKDWGDPMPDSIVDRVMKNLEQKKRGIILFHDIHKQTITALPKLLEKLNKQGYQYVDLDGQPFGSAFAEQPVEKEPVEKQHKPVAKSQFYKDSWAVVVGINQYDSWPKLSYAVSDAKSMKTVLQEKFGFPEDHIYALYDKQATRDNIVELLGDTLANPKRVNPEDRVFIFYAGHGMTRKLPSGRDLGYIIPVDAAFDKFHTRSISMTHLRDFSEMIPAKHVYFVMDSCYSGIALTRSGRTQADSGYLEEITSRTARQILTTGGADQEVADGGPGGHSVFTWTLLQGLGGEADLDGNHIITASELGAYVAPSVSKNSSQTPSFGNMVGSEGGDFVFELPVLKQSKPETVTRDDEITALEKKLAKIEEENQRLREMVENKNVVKTQHPIEAMTPKERKALAVSEHGKGLEFYRKGDYGSALKHLEYAVKLDPVSPTIVNNYGFVLYKAGKLKESLQWLEKTIELEPKRTVVYLNIADTLYELHRQKESVPYYKHYLKLYPSSEKAQEITEKINNINL